MSKITIVSRPEQHLLIDISGCLSFKEAIEQLSAALLSANQFWQGTIVDLDLGKLLLDKAQLAQIIALTKGVGICTKDVFSEHPETVKSLKELEAMLAIAINKEEAANLSSVAMLPDPSEHAELDANIGQMVLFEDKDTSTTAKEIAPVGREMITSVDDLPANNESCHQKQSHSPNDAEQNVPSPGKKQSLYIKQTLRAGQAVSHKGDLVIIGDVNAGAEVLAEGDIAVWGSLRGIAHAGVGGNTKAEIRALRLQPIQLRIAHYIARSPDALLTANSILTASPFMAETAKLVDGKIRILRENFD